jgi:hypothetical protein
MGAGVFLDRVFQVDWKLRPRWLLPATLLVVILIPGMPTLISQFLNGRRYDFKGVAHWLKPRLTPGDAIVSDQPVALGHYLPGIEVQRLRPRGAAIRPGRSTVDRRTGPGARLSHQPEAGRIDSLDLR